MQDSIVIFLLCGIMSLALISLIANVRIIIRSLSERKKDKPCNLYIIDDDNNICKFREATCVHTYNDKLSFNYEGTRYEFQDCQGRVIIHMI